MVGRIRRGWVDGKDKLCIVNLNLERNLSIPSAFVMLLYSHQSAQGRTTTACRLRMNPYGIPGQMTLNQPPNLRRFHRDQIIAWNSFPSGLVDLLCIPLPSCILARASINSAFKFARRAFFFISRCFNHCVIVYFTQV